MNVAFYFEGMFKEHLSEGVFNSLNPPEVLDEKYDPTKHPYWHVFINLHLGKALSLSCLEGNAKLIASLSMEEVIKIDLQGLLDKGLDYYTPYGVV